MILLEILSAAAVVAQPVAGPVPANGTQTYGRDYFDPFAPRTALDIVRQVPGFVLDLGNSEVRGFAGAVGNIVIDGARPSSKSESLESLLARMPASRVLRVDVVAGGTLGADYAGKPQVLNIILSSAVGADGDATISGTRHYSGKFVLDGAASALIKRGRSSFNISAGAGRQDYIEHGTDVVRELSSGKTIENREKVNDVRVRAPYTSASWALDRGKNRQINLNARFAPSSQYLDQDSHVISAGGIRDDKLIQDYKSPVLELGGDVSQPIAGGVIKAVALATRRKRDFKDMLLFRGEGGEPQLGGFEQVQKARLAETIGRLGYTHPRVAGFTVEGGAELAFNRLRSDAAYFELADDGSRSQIDLPLDNAIVTEARAEAYVNAGRSISPTVRLDLGLRYEASHLKVRGDVSAARKLSFLKPSMTLDWKAPGGWHVQASVRRKVAQLDFYDFLSAAELSNGRVVGGNANLVPQRTWEARAMIEHAVLGDGLLKVEAGHDMISLLQDRILTDEGFDAPGNIGSGKRTFVSANLDAPLDRLHLPGFRVKLYGQLQRTRVTDPIWGIKRRFSGYFAPWEWTAEVRRDTPKLAYGFGLERRDDYVFYRATEVERTPWRGTLSRAFLEYRHNPRTLLTLDVFNPLDAGPDRLRTQYLPNRTAQPVVEEFRERFRHASVSLTVKRSFGTAPGKK